MLPDPIIAEVRQVRHEIEAEYENDPQKYYEHIVLLQEKYRHRLAQRKPKLAAGRWELAT